MKNELCKINDVAQTVMIILLLASNPIFTLGFSLVFGVTIWDILKTGLLTPHFWEYEIHATGIIIIWFGLCLMAYAWSNDRRIK